MGKGNGNGQWANAPSGNGQWATNAPSGNGQGQAATAVGERENRPLFLLSTATHV